MFFVTPACDSSSMRSWTGTSRAIRVRPPRASASNGVWSVVRTLIKLPPRGTVTPPAWEVRFGREWRNRTSGAHHHHPGFRDRLPTIRQHSRIDRGVPSGSRTPFSGLKARRHSPRRPMGRCDPAGSRTRSCALRGRRRFRVVHRAVWTARESNPPRVACKASLHPSARPWCWSISRPASRPRSCAASVWAAGIEPAWTWFRARWPAIDPHPVTSCWVTGGDRTRTSSFTARRALQYTTATWCRSPSWNRTSVTGFKGRLTTFDRGKRVVGVEGIEPPSAVCRTAALPLDETPIAVSDHTFGLMLVAAWA